MRYSTSIGIDTHAKKNQVCVIDKKTGEIATAKLSSDPTELIRWINNQGFSKPIRCCYESGPTGFGLARKLNNARICCIVVATSDVEMVFDELAELGVAIKLLSTFCRGITILIPKQLACDT